MFTGLIEDIGTVKKVSGSQISLETKLDDIKRGDSIAVNGVCLTVININGEELLFDYSPRTDKITNLSKLKQNSKVNLERALKLSSRLGGHIVSGHIDGIAKIEKIEKQERFFRIVFSSSQDIMKYCIDKGSVAVDGISLTISSVFEKGFDIYIIPETFNNTVLQFKDLGDHVNIENDILGKYIEKFTNKNKNGISIDMLERNGFI